MDPKSHQEHRHTHTDTCSYTECAPNRKNAGLTFRNRKKKYLKNKFLSAHFKQFTKIYTRENRYVYGTESEQIPSNFVFSADVSTSTPNTPTKAKEGGFRRSLSFGAPVAPKLPPCVVARPCEYKLGHGAEVDSSFSCSVCVCVHSCSESKSSRYEAG